MEKNILLNVMQMLRTKRGLLVKKLKMQKAKRMSILMTVAVAEALEARVVLKVCLLQKSLKTN